MTNYKKLGIFTAVALYMTVTSVQVFVPESFSVSATQLAAAATATQPVTTIFDAPGTDPASLTFEYPSETEVTANWYMPNGCIPWSIDWGDSYKNVYTPPAECGPRAYTHVRTHTYAATSTHIATWSIGSTTGVFPLDYADTLDPTLQCTPRIQMCSGGKISYRNPFTCEMSTCEDPKLYTPDVATTSTTQPDDSVATTTPASNTPETTVATTTEIKPPAPIPAQNCSLAKNLSRGSRGEDVKSLQQFLLRGELLAADSVTGFYGSLTETAVQKFQTTKGIITSGTPASTGYGAVGPRTRAQISLCDAPQSLLPTTVASSTATTTVTATTTPPVEFLGAFIPQIPTNISIGSCPIYPLPICSLGTHIERGTVSVGCLGPSVCVPDEKMTTTNPAASTPAVTTQTTISSEVPVVSSSFAAFPRKGVAPLTINFLSTVIGSYSVTYGDGTPVEYFSGVTAGTSRQFTHTYQTQGTFMAKVQKNTPAASCVSATSCPTLSTTVASIVIVVSEPEVTSPQI